MLNWAIASAIAFSIALIVDIVTGLIRPKALALLEEKYGRNSRVKFLGYGLVVSLIPAVRWVYVVMVVGVALTSLIVSEDKLREQLKMAPKKYDVVAEE